MATISRSVKRMDFTDKITGEAKFTADYIDEQYYYANVVRSTRPHARILDINIPSLPDDVWVARASDVPNNRVLVDIPDQYVLNDWEVQYVGEAILIVVAKTAAAAKAFAETIQISYEDLPACFDMMQSEVILHEKRFVKGNPEQAFQDAHTVFEEVLTTGYQEHAYLEPQSMVVDFSTKKMVRVIGAMQCPFYIHSALKLAFNLTDRDVRVSQATVGGGFGGKEEYPTIIALQAALASYVSGHPIKLILDRHEDIVASTKRHAAHMVYKTALDENGQILGMDINVTLDGGGYLGISTTVIERSILHCLGPYMVDNISVYGSVRKTNNVVTGAFRGFGDPQTIFAVDTHFSHLAERISQDPLAYKWRYLAETNGKTATGGIFRDEVPIRRMVERLKRETDYEAKRKRFAGETGRYRHGIGFGIVSRGCGFAGSAERDFLKSYVQLEKTADGDVTGLAATTEMGQGTHTAFRKIIADTLAIDLARVHFHFPDTQIVPNSGPTNASRSIQTVGRLLQRAAERLKNTWIDGEAQFIEEHYRDEREPLIPFDAEHYIGDAFVTHGWSVTACDVELDTLTGEVTLQKMWGLFDVGTIIDLNMVRGQMHGGLVQGYGYAALEKMEINDGVIAQDRFNNYIIPTAADIGSIWIDFDTAPYPCGPYGAKGAGELAFCGVAAAYVNAVENAAKQHFTSVPLTVEQVFANMEEAK